MKKRREEILKYASKEKRGIEIGPWFAPLAPKREGYSCLSLDVFDRETLLATASKDPNIPKDSQQLIEGVDLVGSSTEIAALVESRGELGQFDYIISSHNFEHIPNPLKFLQGCGQVLKDRGMLSMAIPDRRACFDRFRGNTRLTEWIEAHFELRNQPTPAQIFDFLMRISPDSAERSGSVVDCDLREAFAAWQSMLGKSDLPYRDTHCSTFTPTSFHLLIEESHHLGLSPFSPVEIGRTVGNEFVVHLQNVGCEAGAHQDEGAFRIRRQHLLDRLRSEPNLLDNFGQTPWRIQFSRKLRRALKSAFGEQYVVEP